MEKAIQKFLKTMLLKEYPFFLDVLVKKDAQTFMRSGKECYEVFLVLFAENFEACYYAKIHIHKLAKYLDVEICGIYNEVVTEEEWEEIKSEGGYS